MERKEERASGEAPAYMKLSSMRGSERVVRPEEVDEAVAVEVVEKEEVVEDIEEREFARGRC